MKEQMMESVAVKPWFETWFDSKHYHQLYANRSEQEAQDFVDQLLAFLQPRIEACMIDVGCGAGRHAKYLSAKGFDVTGIDTALSSIEKANQFENSSLRFFQHDMRNSFGNHDYDYVFNFFTSFGYFKSAREHQRVIRNMCDAIKENGTLVIDFLNPLYAADRLVPSEENVIAGVHYNITRWMDEKHFYKKIVIEDPDNAEPFEYTEQVARFNLSDFKQMLYYNGMTVMHVFGDYALTKYNQVHSPRMIMVARKFYM